MTWEEGYMPEYHWLHWDLRNDNLRFQQCDNAQFSLFQDGGFVDD